MEPVSVSEDDFSGDQKSFAACRHWHAYSWLSRLDGEPGRILGFKGLRGLEILTVSAVRHPPRKPSKPSGRPFTRDKRGYRA